MFKRRKQSEEDKIVSILVHLLFLPIYIVIGAGKFLVSLAKLLLYGRSKSRIGAKTTRIGLIDRISYKEEFTGDNGHDYERYVACWLENQGYRDVKVTPKSGDYGADILCIDSDGYKVAVQCKLYQKPVGYKAVEEVLAAMHYYGCNIAMVVTNNTFTKQATSAAKKVGVKLIENVR